MQNRSFYSTAILVTIVFLIAIIPLFKPGVFVSHDGVMHIARIAGFHQALIDGQFPPRWAGNILNGQGSPVLNYNWSLPYWIASLFAALGFNYEQSFELTIAVTLLITFLGVFFWIRQKYQQPLIALLSATLATYAPFTLGNVYTRAALGEALAFALVPWSLFFIDKLLDQYVNFTNFKKMVTAPSREGFRIFVNLGLLIAIWSGLIIAHHPMSLVYLPLTLSYFFVRSYQKNKLFYLKISPFLLLLSFLSTAFFWIPAILEKQYISIDSLGMDLFQTNFIILPQLLYDVSELNFHTWYDLSTTSFVLGWPIWTLFVLSINHLRKQKLSWQKNIKREFILKNLDIIWGISLFVLVLILLIPISTPFWRYVPLISYLLYPWRLISVLVLMASLFMARLMQDLKWQPVQIGLFLVLCLSPIMSFYSFPASFSNDDSYYLSYSGSADLFGEFMTNSLTKEYLQELKEQAIVPPYEIDSSAQVSVAQHQSNISELEIYTDSETNIMLNKIDFPGWHYYLDNEQIRPLKYDNQVHPVFAIPPGNHLFQAILEDTPTQSIAELISFTTILLSTLVLLFLGFKTK